MADAPDESTAKITGQSIGMGIAADGKPAQGYDLTFKTAAGNDGRLFVATRDYTPDKIGPLVREAAQNIDAVLGLRIPQN